MIARAGLTALGLVAVVALTGCGQEQDQEAQGRRAIIGELLEQGGQTTGPVVATVNGASIPARVLRRSVEQAQGTRTRQELLDDLILAQLQGDKALAEGFGDSQEIQNLHAQLMVQRLLEEAVERRAAPEAIPAAEVKAYYDENYFLYKDPEMRAADHLLIKPSSKKWDPRGDPAAVPAEVRRKAHELAASIRAEITAEGLPATRAPELEVIARRWEGRVPEDLEVIVEQLPPFPRREFGKQGEPGFRVTVVEPFADAAFSLAVGVLSEPVDTDFGTHLLVVNTILPATEIPLSEAEPGIRELLALRRRMVLSAALVEELTSKAQIAWDTSLLEKLQGDQSKATP